MASPIPKAPERRQRRNERAVLSAVPIDLRPVNAPEPPAGLSVASRAAWGRLWASPLARAFAESDLPALERLFLLRNERDRSFRAAGRSRLVAGSQGQPVLSPLLGYVASLDAEIRQLEDRFGLSPRARLQLGVTLGEATRSLAELNRSFLEEVG